MNALGRILRRERELSGLTQMELGQRLGIWKKPAQRIFQWESGYRRPRSAAVEAMERIFGLAPGTVIAEAQQTEREDLIMEQMMETILARRSTRSYQNRPVEKEKLEKLLQAAIHGPSAINLQPWVYTVLNRKTRDDLVAGMGDDIFYGAPTVVMVSCDKNNIWSPIDCGLSGENFLLMAQALGLGTCLIGCMREFLATPAGRDIIARLKLPENYGPLYAIAVGYPDGKSNARPRDESKVVWMEES